MNKIIFYIVIGFIVFVACFHIVFCDSHATDLPVGFSQSAINSLNSYTNPTEYTFGNSPEQFVFGVNKAIDEINLYLYQNYGYDLEDLSIDVYDDLTDPTTVSDHVIHKITGEDYDTSSAAAAGFKLFSYAYINGLQDLGSNVKTYVLGKWDEVTNTVTDIYDNVVAYIDDNFFSAFSSVTSGINSGQSPFLDISDTNLYFYKTQTCLYYNNFTASQTYQGRLIYQCDIPIFTYKVSNSIHFVVPSSLIIDRYTCNIKVTDISSNGQIISSYNTIWPDIVSTFLINNVLYYDIRDYSNLSKDTQYDFEYSSLAEIQSFISTYDPYNFDNAITYDYTEQSKTAIQELLDQLKGHYVTVDDLASLIDTLEGEAVVKPIPVTDDETGEATLIPELDLSDETLARLQDIIDNILADAIDFDTYFPEPTPTPTPDPGPDYTIPDGIWPSFIPDLLPEDMFSMFRPIFDIVGTDYSMYSLWILIPSILIFILAVYILVSLF